MAGRKRWEEFIERIRWKGCRCRPWHGGAGHETQWAAIVSVSSTGSGSEQVSDS